MYKGAADGVDVQLFIPRPDSFFPMTRAVDTDLWYVTVEIQEGSRVEYKIQVTSSGRHEWIEDPLNPFVARGAYGTNSVCHGFGYTKPDWAIFDPGAGQGLLEEITIQSRALRRLCSVTMYLPINFGEEAAYPLIVVHDGGDYLAYSDLKIVLDNLIDRGEVAPLVVALLHPHNRLTEYADDPGHARFVARELLPEVEHKYGLIARPELRALMGASFGAIAALSTAYRYPGLFGSLLLQSGTFAMTDIGPLRADRIFTPVLRFISRFRDHPRRVVERAFLSCGTYEPLLKENGAFSTILESTGIEVRYVEAPDGHNWENWRDRLGEGLPWLFPRP